MDPSDSASARDVSGEVPAEQLIWLVRRFRQAMADDLAQRGAQPVPAAAKWLLLAVDRRAATVGDLAAQLGITKQAVSRMGDRLVDLGCCVREENSGDRREVILRCTAEGSRVAGALRETLVRVQSELLAPLTPARRSAFLELLAEVSAG